MIKLPFRRLLPTALDFLLRKSHCSVFYLIFFWLFTLFLTLPFFNPPVLAQPTPQWCASQGLEYCVFDEGGGNIIEDCVPIGSCNSQGTGGSGGGGSGGTSGVGTIRPPAGFNIPQTSDPQTFVAGLVRNGIALMIIIAFIVDLIWTILAGYRFILAQGDPKTISAAWSQIYWGLIGLVVIMGSFAIIRIAETFFNVDIITSGLRLPTGFTP